MNRETALSLALALLVAASVGLSAGTLDAAIQPEPVGGESPASVSDSADEGRIDAPQPPAMTLVEREPCVRALGELPATAAVVLFLGLIFGYVYRDSGSTALAAVITTGPAIPVLAVREYLTDCRAVGQDEESGLRMTEMVTSPDTDAILQAADETAGSTPTALLAALILATLVVGVAAVLVTRRGDDDAGDAPPTEEERDADVEAARRAAGEAADRIEAAEAFDNEVFRAWREMADSLDVPRPEASTPGEFAAAAVASGLDREAVADLTDAFERVRYGDADPTGEHERRATAALRRIEAGGSGEGAGDADRDGDDAGDASGGDRR